MSTGKVVEISRTDDLALGIGRWVREFLNSGDPPESVIRRTFMFRKDAMACGLSALACGANAPRVFRKLAMALPVDRLACIPGTTLYVGAPMYGATKQLFYGPHAARAMMAADREWDSNGTNFGYDPERGNVAGEFGHNDFYSAMEVAARMAGADGVTLMRAYIAVDTIRGRLGEVFALRNYFIDHVLHGGIAVAAVAVGLFGGTPEQIASAISVPLFNAVPFRAIRAGKQLSDNKGASASINAWIALEGAIWVMSGFQAAGGGLNNPENVMSLFQGGAPKLRIVDLDEDELPAGSGNSYDGPFDLWFPLSGEEGWPIDSMHIKLGLYEHQSAGALQAVQNLLREHPQLIQHLASNAPFKVTIGAYQPAYGIIGKAEKYKPETRQSADHSMVYIIATLLRLAAERQVAGWAELMLLPEHYTHAAIHNPQTRAMMTPDVISFVHDPELDAHYPEGIPSWVKIEAGGQTLDSGVVLFPQGHAKCQGDEFQRIHAAKLNALGALALGSAGAASEVLGRVDDVIALEPDEICELYDFGLMVPDVDFDAA